MTATHETPTFFGPSASPLFGVVHLPADYRVRGGVVVCTSIGKDGTDTTRAIRGLGNALAQRGVATLRFDYLGAGDSSYGQGSDEALQWMRDSIAHAVGHLRQMGIDDISLVGVRAGCLVMESVPNLLDSVRRQVLWDPVGTGRFYLREQAAIFAMAAGEDDVPAGVVSILGTRLSEQAAKEISELRLGETDWTGERLVIGRSEGADKRVRALMASPGTESVAVAGLAECAQPARLLPPVSWDAVDAALGWLDRHIPTGRTAVRSTPLSWARIPDRPGPSPRTVLERIETTESGGMFAIRTVPDDVPATGKTVLFCTNANNVHHGTNREWVELARAAAYDGAQAVRWDRRGAGESGTPHRGEEVIIYSPVATQDAVAASRHATDDTARLLVVGICSGSWLAAAAARDRGADKVILVSTLLWSWRIKKAISGVVQPGADDSIDWESTPRARLRQNLQRRLPYAVWMLLGRLGVSQAPEVLLRPLARKGIHTSAILAPADTALFTGNRGERGVTRLRRSAAPPEVTHTAAGDHAAYHQAVLTAMREQVLAWVTD